MPLAARPAAWLDWSTILRDVTPREWPKRLFAQGSQAYADLVAFGESLALARDMLSFLQHNIWPAKDANDNVFTDRWEAVFDIQPSGTTDDRTSRLIALFRQRGTMTEDLVKAIMCRAWDSDDPDVVRITYPDPADVATLNPAEDWQWALPQTNLHLYHFTETVEPNWKIAQDIINKIKPTWETWSFGKNRYLKWGVHADDGEWDRRVWG
jgi:hypothetical protein